MTPAARLEEVGKDGKTKLGVGGPVLRAHLDATTGVRLQDHL